MTDLASPKTNSTTNLPFPKSLEHFPFDIPPEEFAKIMNGRVHTPELNAKLKQLSKTLLVRPVKSLALIREEVLANIADPVKVAECAEDWAVSLLKELNDNPEFKFTPRVFAELKQLAEIVLPRNQQQTHGRGMTSPAGNQNEKEALFLAGTKIPLDAVPEIINDGRKLLATVADPIYAVQWAKCVSFGLLGRKDNRKDKDTFTLEEIAEANQLTKLFLSDYPRKNAPKDGVLSLIAHHDLPIFECAFPPPAPGGETVQISPEAFSVAPGMEAAVMELGRYWMQQLYDAHAANVPSSPPKKSNGGAPVSPLPSDDTGLAAFADPKKFQDAKRKMAHHADDPRA